MVLSDGLIAYWKMDEASGADRVDDIGTFTMLENGGSVASTAGIINDAANFTPADGVELQLANKADLDNDTFSVSLWMKPTLVSGGVLMSHKVGGNAGWAVGLFGTGSLAFTMDDVRIDITGSFFVANVLHHVVITRINGGAAKVYVDTVVETSISDSGTTDFAALASTLRTTIAALTNGSESYEGFIDEVGYWDRELSATEVSNLFNGGAALSLDDILAGGGPPPPTGEREKDLLVTGVDPGRDLGSNPGVFLDVAPDIQECFDQLKLQSDDMTTLERGASRVTRTAVQSIPTGAATTVEWENEVFDDQNIVDLGSDDTAMTIPSTITQIEATAGFKFAANATGVRRARIKRDSVVVAEMTVSAVSGEVTGGTLTTGPIEVSTTQKITLEVEQDSGGALDLVADTSFLSVKILA